MKTYYYLAPDIAVVDLGSGNYLFKSDTIVVKLEGESTKFMVQNILPLLNGENDLEAISQQLSSIPKEDLQLNLNQLVKSGVLKSSVRPKSEKATDNHTTRFFSNFLEITNSNDPSLLDAVVNSSIAVAGLEAHGTQTILALLQAGFKNFKIIDPFPCNKDDHNTFPFIYHEAQNRQDGMKHYLQKEYPAVKVETGPEALTKEYLEEFVQDCNLIIVCADKGFSSIFYWVNKISVERKIPALYSSIKGPMCYAGPFAIPGKTSCYMCYKMRNVAMQEDFDAAMAYEEMLNNQKQPSLFNRSLLPGAINFIASALSSEVLKFFYSFGSLTLNDKVLEYNSLSYEIKSHTILQKPDCPVCKKKEFKRVHYSSGELINSHQPSNLGQLLNELVSPLTGIIKELEISPKDITEPKLPLIYSANLPNHSFLPAGQQQKYGCSGKGLDTLSAKISAAGEGIERYSGAVYYYEEIIYTSYHAIKDEALDPSQLVLFLPEQYSSLDYLPFDPEAEIGWMKAFSLVNEKPIYVPATAVPMNYQQRSNAENIFPGTSNGLGAGSSMLNAVLAAAGEVIERDAFMIMWHNKLPCLRIDPLSHPSDEVVKYFNAYRRRGVELRLYKLPTDTPMHVFMGIGVQVEGEGPAVVVGLGAGFSAAGAARSALLEVGQVRPALKQRLRIPKELERRKELIANPDNVEALEDHDLLYSSIEMLKAFDFLFRIPFTTFNWDDAVDSSPAENLNALITYCRNDNTDLIYYNLTPPDMEKLGLFTARVILPDFQPIHFGHKNLRKGGNRLFELPVKLGFRNARVQSSELYHFPHPLA